MKLEHIPVVVHRQSTPAARLSGNARVLLGEIAASLQKLLEHGESTTIDLLAMPLNAADLDWLRQQLGQGEICITLNADGESTLQETSCPGVWWVQHHNPAGGVLSAFIEITPVPDLVRAHQDDMHSGLERLTQRIEELTGPQGRVGE
jgi:hydrogenase-1 operon protein HyaF